MIFGNEAAWFFILVALAEFFINDIFNGVASSVAHDGMNMTVTYALIQNRRRIVPKTVEPTTAP